MEQRYSSHDPTPETSTAGSQQSSPGDVSGSACPSDHEITTPNQQDMMLQSIPSMASPRGFQSRALVAAPVVAMLSSLWFSGVGQAATINYSGGQPGVTHYLSDGSEIPMT